MDAVTPNLHCAVVDSPFALAFPFGQPCLTDHESFTTESMGWRAQAREYASPSLRLHLQFSLPVSCELLFNGLPAAVDMGVKIMKAELTGMLCQCQLGRCANLNSLGPWPGPG
eukprot:512724-Rhodomonas_salina.1